MKAIAKRGESVWLVTDEDDADDPKYARVLDLSQLKLFPPYPTASILDRGDWEDVDEQPDLESMLRGVDQLDGKARDDAMQPGGLGASH